MAKRFIDTELFKKKFVRSLKAPYKLLWVYLFCDCTHAGIWECEFDVAESRLSQKINWDTAKKIFSPMIIEVDDGAKWFIPSFIDFQYGQLSKKNPAHNNIIKILTKYNLLNESLKPLESTFQGTMDKEMEKVKEKETGKGNVFVRPTLEEVGRYCVERKNRVDADVFFNHYQSNGWKVGKNSMKDWQAAIRTWEKNSFQDNTKTTLRPKDAIGTVEDMKAQKL